MTSQTLEPQRVRKGKTAPWAIRRTDVVTLACIAVSLAAAPLLLPVSWLSVALYAMIYTVAAIGLTLLMGLAGQVSLGQAAFFAIGAYTQAWLVTEAAVSPLLAVIPSVVTPVLVALLVGVPLLRLRGHFLALGTLGLGIIISVLAAETDALGGTSGIFGVPAFSAFGYEIASIRPYFLLVAAAVVVGLLLARNLTESRVGVALSATNDSEVAAECLGVDTFRYRLKVFMVSAGYAGLAGVLFVHWQTVVNPSAAGFQFSVQLLLICIVGGLGSVYGAIIGAVAVALLDEGARTLVPQLISGASGEVQLIGFGIVLVLVVMAAPGGIHQGLVWLAHKVKGAPAAPQAMGLADVAGRASLPEFTTHLPPSGTKVLDVKGLTKRFGGVVAVRNFSIEVHAGEILALIGPNGAGKTTCFNLLSGVLPPSDGRVEVRGTELTGSKPHVFAAAGLTRTFQNLETFSSSSVAGSVRVGRHLHGSVGLIRGALAVGTRDERVRTDRDVRAFLQAVGLSWAAATPAVDLSFGQRRMLEIVRSMAAEPCILLLDEPLAGLTSQERDHVLELLRSLRDGGVAVVLVEHDMRSALSVADRVAVLDDGVLIALNTPDNVREDPAVIAAYLGVDVDDSPLGRAEGELDVRL